MEKRVIDANVQELITLIKDAVIPELTEKLSEQFTPKQPEKYMTRAEVCTMLDIDLTTLWRWSKSGTLTAYNIGGKVLYKRSEVEDAIEAGSTKKGTVKVPGRSIK